MERKYEEIYHKDNIVAGFTFLFIFIIISSNVFARTGIFNCVDFENAVVDLRSIEYIILSGICCDTL